LTFFGSFDYGSVAMLRGQATKHGYWKEEHIFEVGVDGGIFHKFKTHFEKIRYKWN
jgi:hypothetical protein